jgi:hypothetical protein
VNVAAPGETRPKHAPGTLLTARLCPEASTVSWCVLLLYDTGTVPVFPAPGPSTTNEQPGRLVVTVQRIAESVPGVTPPDVAAVAAMTSLLVQLTVNVKNPAYVQVLKRGLTFVLIVRVVALDAALPTAEALTQSSVAPPTVRIECVVDVAVIAVGLGLTTTDAASAADAAVSDPIAIAPTTANFLNFENILGLLML